MVEPLILCPVCRAAVPDRDYDAHAAAHQRAKASPIDMKEWVLEQDKVTGDLRIRNTRTGKIDVA